MFADIEKIAKAIGSRQDYVQAGGGNISLKVGDVMAVKASGVRIADVTADSGYVEVDYAAVASFCRDTVVQEGIDYTAQNGEVMKRAIVKDTGARPSVETGFHAILKKAVIHTHSAYANILTAAAEGEQLSQKLGIPHAWVNYVTPGFYLTKEIIAELAKYESEPNVIFIRNHGLIVTHDDVDVCIALHEEVNAKLRDILGINEAYPIAAVANNASATPFVREYVEANGSEDIINYPLFPDQLVYLNSSLGTKLDLALTYNASEYEQLQLEETLVAFFYVLHHIRRLNLTITTMTKQQVDFICNWEEEKYRKSVSAKK